MYTMMDMSLEEAVGFSSKLLPLTKDNEVTFDFSGMTNFEPLPMLGIGSVMRRYISEYPKVNFKISGYDSCGKHYAGVMGFFKYVFPLFEIGKMPGEAKGSKNYIPITLIEADKLQRKERERGNFIDIRETIEKEAGRLSSVLDRGNAEVHEMLVYVIREILRNIPEHADTDKMWICGQYWPSDDLAEIAIIDEGIGIHGSMIKNRTHNKCIKTNLNALEMALKAGISESFSPLSKQNRNEDVWANSGFGLYTVSEICKQLGGDFCIISYGDYILVNDESIKSGHTFFNGTAIRIRIYPGRINDAQKIISEMVAKGEQEAKTRRNAFKCASKRSRGLYY